MSTLPSPDAGYVPRVGDRVDVAIRGVTVDCILSDGSLDIVGDDGEGIVVPDGMMGVTVTPAATPNQPVTWVWLVTASRGLDAHLLPDRDADATVCGWSTSTGIRLSEADAQERYQAGRCVHCWPGPGHSTPAAEASFASVIRSGVCGTSPVCEPESVSDPLPDQLESPLTTLLAARAAFADVREQGEAPAAPTKGERIASELRRIADRIATVGDDDMPRVRLNFQCGYPLTAAEVAAARARVDATVALLGVPPAAVRGSGGTCHYDSTQHGSNGGLSVWVYATLPDTGTCTQCGQKCGCGGSA